MVVRGGDGVVVVGYSCAVSWWWVCVVVVGGGEGVMVMGYRCAVSVGVCSRGRRWLGMWWC